jgi:pyruvate/2-oxoglutarate/acetoin dehydrogenase E1 component
MAHIVKHEAAAERLEHDGISAEAIDVRSLVPLGTSTLLESVAKSVEPGSGA